MEGFKSLTVWQKAYQFGLDNYRLTRNFPRHEQFGLASQIRRAGISISANIAEGYERQYRKEYIQFLNIAKGSLGEIETYLMFSKDLGYMTETLYQEMEIKRQEIGKMLRGLIKSLLP